MYKRCLFFIVVMIFLLPVVVQGQSESCEPILGFQYDAVANVLHLVNRVTGDIVQSYEDVRDFITLASSPDCRFIVGSVWHDYTGTERDHEKIVGDTTVWNASTGEQYHIFEDAHQIPHLIEWSPDSERLILYTRNGFFLWNFFTNQRTPLTPPNTYRVGWFINSIWAESDRHELFVLPYQWHFSSHMVYLYDWLSGETIATFDTYVSPQTEQEMNKLWLDLGYRVDERFIYVYRSSGSPNSIKIYDRNSYQLLYSLNGGTNGAEGSQLIGISPDGHYLVIGFRTLRVWDLWNLPENFEDRTATYQYRIDRSGVNRVRFIDNTTVEITLDNNNLLKMNVETGEKME